MKKILCYGDSNTYGYLPRDRRFDSNSRWSGRLQLLLGNDYQVAEEGLNGRTTSFRDEFFPERCGIDEIEKFVKLYGPLDLLIIMLGTNDCKSQFHLTADMICGGMEKVLDVARDAGPENMKILLIAPTPLREIVLSDEDLWFKFDHDSIHASEGISKEYRTLAQKLNCSFLDAGQITKAGDADGVHLDAAGHEALAQAVAEKVHQILD